MNSEKNDMSVYKPGHELHLEHVNSRIRFLHRIIRLAVKVFSILMVIVIVWGIGDVIYALYQRLTEPPFLLLQINDILATFGAFIAVLIAIKIYEVGNYGYLLLAVSGAFLTANNLFGGTTGHARFVTTQLQLEKIIAVGTVKWNELENKLDQDADKAPEIELEMFQFIIRTLEEAYQLIIEETNGQRIA